VDLTAAQRTAVQGAVEELYQGFKIQLLGRWFKGSTIWFEHRTSVNPQETLEGLFRYALHHMYGPGAAVDEEQLGQLFGVTQNYLDSAKLTTMNQVLAAVAQAETIANLQSALKDVFKKATSKVEQITVTEARNASSFAEREGISQVASSLGIDDPNVCKLTRRDNKLCKTCAYLWNDPKNPLVPRIYKLSELREGYCDHKDPLPVIGPTHPRCRCVMIMVAPNYGFDESGKLKFVAFGHDEYAYRNNSLGKSEQFQEVLWEPCDCSECQHDENDPNLEVL
jgi:hypothetical protein